MISLPLSSAGMAAVHPTGYVTRSEHTAQNFPQEPEHRKYAMLSLMLLCASYRVLADAGCHALARVKTR